jgi:hypothetical protein
MGRKGNEFRDGNEWGMGRSLRTMGRRGNEFRDGNEWGRIEQRIHGKQRIGDGEESGAARAGEI